jgi:hypothetical protein
MFCQDSATKGFIVIFSINYLRNPPRVVFVLGLVSLINSPVSDCTVPCHVMVHPEYAYSSALLLGRPSLIKLVLVNKFSHFWQK